MGTSPFRSVVKEALRGLLGRLYQKRWVPTSSRASKTVLLFGRWPVQCLLGGFQRRGCERGESCICSELPCTSCSGQFCPSKLSEHLWVYAGLQQRAATEATHWNLETIDLWVLIRSGTCFPEGVVLVVVSMTTGPAVTFPWQRRVSME